MDGVTLELGVAYRIVGVVLKMAMEEKAFPRKKARYAR